jgi:hypothetical protein
MPSLIKLDELIKANNREGSKYSLVPLLIKLDELIKINE